MSNFSSHYVSRAALKLEHALREFHVDVRDRICADFGCNVGGFTDCLLQHGAARVFAIDTGYGALHHRLRTDERVTVLERTNALHFDPLVQFGADDAPFEGAHLVTIDLAWTPQRHAIPAALRWLRADGRIITLIKPHYELTEAEKQTHLHEGRLDPQVAEQVLHRVLHATPELGAMPLQHAQSPLTGSKSARKGPGNVEYLALLKAR